MLYRATICWTRENLNNREGQTDRTPVDNDHLLGLQRTFDAALNFDFKEPLYINIEDRCAYKV